MKIDRFGWQPDLPDHRDYTMAYRTARLPQVVDLRPKCPTILDQGQLGSCTANAIANCYKFVAKKENLPVINPSRLFIYYNERAIEGTVPYDAGAQIRDGFKTISKQGACDESIWPYDIDKFADAPSDHAYTEAVKHEAVQYQRIDNTNLNALKQCLADGYPFVFGFSVYEGFESLAVERTGLVQIPKAGEAMLGGHAVYAVGYSDRTRRIIAANSWGPYWGAKGYFTLPYSYVINDNLAADFWTIRKVT